MHAHLCHTYQYFCHQFAIVGMNHLSCPPGLQAFLVYYRVVQKNYMRPRFEPFAEELHGFPQNAWVTVYQSIQNLYQLVRYSLINSRNWIHVMSNVTLHVNMSPDS